MEYTFTVANFEEEVLNSPLPVLVDFYADPLSSAFQTLSRVSIRPRMSM